MRCPNCGFDESEESNDHGPRGRATNTRPMRGYHGSSFETMGMTPDGIISTKCPRCHEEITQDQI
jgi:hypothetical protein